MENYRDNPEEMTKDLIRLSNTDTLKEISKCYAKGIPLPTPTVAESIKEICDKGLASLLSDSTIVELVH